MKASIEPTENGRTAVRITADWAEVAADYEDLLADYARLPAPGFRAGKAPRAVVERRFRGRIRDDLTARCGRRLVRDALRERNLRAGGPIPVVEAKLEPYRELSFVAECVPVPKLDLPEYSAVPLIAGTDDERRDELSAWLLERTAWDVPEPLVREECERGEATEPGVDPRREAAERVKLMLILEQIAETDGIEVEEREVDARIERMATGCGIEPAALRRQLGEQGVSRLRSLLLAEQTLDYLLSSATVEGREKPEAR